MPRKTNHAADMLPSFEHRVVGMLCQIISARRECAKQPSSAVIRRGNGQPVGNVPIRDQSRARTEFMARRGNPPVWWWFQRSGHGPRL